MVRYLGYHATSLLFNVPIDYKRYIFNSSKNREAWPFEEALKCIAQLVHVCK